MNPLDVYRAAQAAAAAPKGGDTFYLRADEKKKRIYKPGANGVGIERVRLLANQARMLAGENPFFTEVFFHIRDTRDAKGNSREYEIYCPKRNDGAVCACCNKEQSFKEQAYARREVLKAQGITDSEQLRADEEAKTAFRAANKWQARKFTVVELVERARMGEGKKFWFIKDNLKKEGGWDKLGPQIDAMVNYATDVTDVNTGRDLDITVVDMKRVDNNGFYKGVHAVVFAPVGTPLSPNPEEVARLVADTTVWRQVKRPTEVRGYLTSSQFLDETAAGRMPIWDDTASSPGNKYKGAWIMYPPGGQPFYAFYDQSPEAKAKALGESPGVEASLTATSMGANVEQPTYQQPQAQAQQPAYQQPAPQQQPAYQQQQPAYQQPQQPAYQQPAPQQPQQPAYQQPVQQQPVYQQPQGSVPQGAPVYQAPAYISEPAAQPQPPTGGVKSYRDDTDELPF